MQLRERIIPNSEMADVNSNFNSAVEASLLELERLGMSRVLGKEKVKAICTLVFRTRFARSTKTYTTFTTCQNAACSNTFFFFWRVDHALEGSMLWLSKCDFSRLFPTERSWHAYWFSMVFEFLVSMICPFPASRGLSSWETSASREICPLMQQRFLWPLLRRKALFCG